MCLLRICAYSIDWRRIPRNLPMQVGEVASIRSLHTPKIRCFSSEHHIEIWSWYNGGMGMWRTCTCRDTSWSAMQWGKSSSPMIYVLGIFCSLDSLIIARPFLITKLCQVEPGSVWPPEARKVLMIVVSGIPACNVSNGSPTVSIF